MTTYKIAIIVLSSGRAMGPKIKAGKLMNGRGFESDVEVELLFDQTEAYPQECGDRCNYTLLFCAALILLSALGWIYHASYFTEHN